MIGLFPSNKYSINDKRMANAEAIILLPATNKDSFFVS